MESATRAGGLRIDIRMWLSRNRVAIKASPKWIIQNRKAPSVTHIKTPVTMKIGYVDISIMAEA